MPKFIVRVSYRMERDINVWASSEAEAEEKACEIVENWNGVVSAEPLDVEEE